MSIATPPSVPAVNFSTKKEPVKFGTRTGKQLPGELIGHWNHLFERLSCSPDDFYRSIHAALGERGLPDIHIGRIFWSESGILSGKREYMRVRRKEFTFDLCGAPFGNGFFVSSWVGKTESGFAAILKSIPVIGVLFANFIKPLTYYQIDAALMFQESVHNAVLEVMDGMATAVGIPPVPESSRKPINKEFFAK